MTAKKFIAVLAVFLTLLSVFVFVLVKYLNTELNMYYSSNDNFEFNGIFFENDKKARIYRPLSRGFEDFEKKSIDLSEYGFEGKEYSYFSIDQTAYSDNAGTWTVCKENKFIYVDENNKKYIIDTERKKSYPVFSGSQVSLDEYAENVLAFSPNAHYAIELNDDVITLYISDNDPENFKINEIKQFSLKEFGAEFRFGAFVNTKEAYFYSVGSDIPVFVAFDASEGKLIKSKLIGNKEYGKVLNNIFIERFEDNEKYLSVAWSNVLLGNEYSVCLPKEDFKSAELIAVSTGGEYAAFKASDNSGNEKIYIGKGKKYAEIPIGDREIKSIDFVENNIFCIQFENVFESYKVCF